MTHSDELRVLSHALDQAGDVLARVREDRLGEPTPCEDWTVADLADHLIAAPVQFRTMVEGSEVDWATPAPQVRSGWASTFRNAADDLIHAWHQREESTQLSPDMATSEFAVHTWDLATALGVPSSELDPEVAERALAFMGQGLTAENRAPVFEPERQAPEGADPYTRLAAFAGRRV